MSNDAEADRVLALLSWLGEAPTNYVHEARRPARRSTRDWEGSRLRNVRLVTSSQRTGARDSTMPCALRVARDALECWCLLRRWWR